MTGLTNIAAIICYELFSLELGLYKTQPQYAILGTEGNSLELKRI